jgi:outer membrane protein assembly factor BamB
MGTSQLDESTPKPLRLWPGVVAVVLQWLAWQVLPIISPGAIIYAIFGGIFGGGLAVLVWWMFFSRAPWFDRAAGLLMMVAAVFATKPFIDPSIAGGMMGMMFVFFPIPVLCAALVGWAVVSRNMSAVPRRVALVVATLLACAVFLSVRTEGITGEGQSQYAWRWSKTPEQKLLTEVAPEPLAPPPAKPENTAESTTTSPAPVRTITASLPGNSPSNSTMMAPAHVTTASVPEWPGFRGPHRDGIVRGVRIDTDWAANPPVQLWRRPIGPGWSSFAIADGLIYTQEQRGDDELVTCYSLSTGKPVWKHSDPARFYESNGGAGPRGTPTLSNGRVYTLGATGIVNALDARSGAVIWSHNVATDASKKTPGWGFSGSPLVIGDLVVVAAAGKLAAYEAVTGKSRWFGPNGGDGYSSPQGVIIDGVEQVLLLSQHGAVSVAPADGKVLWEYKWASDTRIMQPAVASDSDILMSAGDAMGGGGIRRLAIANGPGGWITQEKWTSSGLKPNLSDYAVHDGHAYGFDGSILSCIDLKDGKRAWKGGRYGSGQLVMLDEQGLLLVSSEEGDLALVSATPDQDKELAKVPALKDKTWNHPAMAGNTLLVRNGEEMIAFKLAVAR